MRTRFLTNFFNSSAASQSLQALDFLQFPPPQLPSPDVFKFDNLSCFDQVNSLNISPEIERFSVDEALSKFFSDVLPQDINIEIEQRSTREVASEALRSWYMLVQDKINEDAAAQTNFTVVTFETPELCASMEDSCSLHEEKMQIFFKVTDTEVSPDLLDFSLEVQQLVDIHKSIFNVEDCCLEFQEEHRSDLLEDGRVVKAQISSDLRTFPLLEVDEISLGINSYISEDKHMIFESNDPQQFIHKHELTCDAKDLLLYLEFDLFENLLNHPSLACHKFEIPCTNFVLEENIINVIEHPMTDGYFSLTLSQLAFEELQFFDINTSNFSEVFFDTEIISEVEQCEQMFGDTPLSTFNGLIVTHELILRDDSFKSLPVPIISDHEKIMLVEAIVEDIFLKLKLQPSSTSDGIYLDWHLLEDDICTQSITTSIKMFEDIDTYSIGADMNLCDSRLLILEFVLSDACLNELKTEEKSEVLNIERSENLTEHVCHDGIDLSKLNDICKKAASDEDLVDNKVNRVHQPAESMSQFNDLDFFLNPLEATCVEKQKAADKKLEMDCIIPVVSVNTPKETHNTSQKQQQSLENELHSRGDFLSTSTPNERSKNSEGPLHSSSPVEKKNSMKSVEATCKVPQLPLAMDPKKIHTNTPSFPNSIIIVNTQNVETEMIISRRSTYQRILAMEKEGVQVVERDINLPVDVIVSTAVCLVLYDSKNIRRKTSSSDDASSFLSSCIENIAANVLTSLSFAFSSCILIFEGEVRFLAGIMESSDELYAAAASLGIDLQLFCSYSFEITDEIILNCIAHAAKSTRGLYPKMPESETLAESFLSKFPSLNPLSAHAILSSVGKLVDFFEMSHQQRVCAVQKCLVPNASITLFSALCHYGEREDSRSVMTDCCSSVSSGHDSGYCCPKSDHELKKRKYIGSPEAKAMPMEYSFQFEQNNDVKWDPPKSVTSNSFMNLEAEEVYNDIKNQRSDACMMLNGPTLTETSIGKRKKVHMPIVDNIVSHTNNNSTGLLEEFKRDVIDINDDATTGEDFSFLHPTKLSSDWCSLPSFPTAAEIRSDIDSWIPTKDNGQSLSEGFILNSNPALMNNITSLQQQQMSSEECSIINSPVNFSRLPFKEKDPCYSRTPLTKAIFSDQPQKGSPWTIDFLNRIKEKSRLRHQSLPNISSAPCFGYSENSSKFRKRKSPSILNFYRYQRSSADQAMENKGQKIPIQPSSSSKAVKTLPSLSQTWTPIDKRAKRKLTFATNGSKGQSKLIWSDKTGQTQKGRL